MTVAPATADTVLIIGIESGIGADLATRYRATGARVIGTSRSGAADYKLDVNDPGAIARLRDELTAAGVRWNMLVVSVGVLAPIAPFVAVDFALWEASFRANSIAQWQLVQALHPLRGDDPTVLFFAGGAVNGVLENYSNYGVAKIALIKMVEYLQREDPATRYAILGPGWVPTKIHQQTLDAGAHAGPNRERTQAYLDSGNLSGSAHDAYAEVAASIDWIRQQPREITGGRNFSTVFDPWGERPGNAELTAALAADPHLYKLRRAEVSMTTAPAEDLIAEILAALPTVPAQQARTTPLYAALRDSLAPVVKTLFSDTGTPRRFGPFGQLSLPYVKMGAVDSCDLFGLDELIIFAYYWANKGRYKKAADIGANLGLHSIILGKSGLDVRAYEPDPMHAAILAENLKRNDVTNVDLRIAGVSDRSGNAEFVRVLGNTTSSHIAGSKDAYGDLDTFSIALEDINDVVAWADFIKMDAEGHETTIFCALAPDVWKKVDVMAEIGTPANAQVVFDHFKGSAINMFSQKTGWGKVTSVDAMPTTYKEGSLFLTSQPAMNWS